MGHARIRCCLIAAALALLLAGCASPEPSEKDTVRSTILRYNELLADGYRALNMNGMREVADELQSEDEYIHMSSLAEGGIRLDSDLADIKFVRISIETTTAQAETKETWDYRQYGRTDGKLILEQKGLVYHLAWDLAKQTDGRWLVTDVRVISATSTVEPRVLSTITPMPSRNP